MEATVMPHGLLRSLILPGLVVVWLVAQVQYQLMHPSAAFDACPPSAMPGTSSCIQLLPPRLVTAVPYELLFQSLCISLSQILNKFLVAGP